MNINQCRDTGELNPLCRCLLELALADIRKQGVTPLVVETYRTQERQNYLYCQGREVAECTAKGISLQVAKMYCTPKASQVSWTINSIHTLKNAVDVIPQRKDKTGKWVAIWDVKDKQTQIIIKTMQKYGFEAGVNWKGNPDSPHYQIKGVSTGGKYFTAANTNAFITRLLQSGLNRKTGVNLTVDGAWGVKTTEALNQWRLSKKWTANGNLGEKALRELLKEEKKNG